MSDVLARLMEWMETSDVEDADVVLRDAITEIAGLRARLDEHRIAIRRLAEQDATLSVSGGSAVRCIRWSRIEGEGEVADGRHKAAGR